MSNPYGGVPPFPDQPDPSPYGATTSPYGAGSPPQPPPYGLLPPVPSGLAKAAIGLAIAYTALRVVAAVLSYPMVVAANDVATETTPATTTWILLILSAVLSIAAVVLLFSIWVVGSLWLMRSYEFLRALRPTFHMQRSIAWTWLGWWVPIVSFWFPVQIVDDIQRGTAHDESRPSLAGWWSAWLIGLITTQISAQVASQSEVLSHDATMVVAFLDGIAGLAIVIGCVLWISIIRRITRDQEAARR